LNVLHWKKFAGLYEPAFFKKALTDPALHSRVPASPALTHHPTFRTSRPSFLPPLPPCCRLRKLRQKSIDSSRLERRIGDRSMTCFITLAKRDFRGRALSLEYALIGPEKPPDDAPVLVFLHDGLGCVALWRGFPAALCARLRWRGLVYSRFACGASTPRPLDEPFPSDYLEREALEVLPALLRALGIERPWLLGHSDGGSIALIAAGSDAARYAGLVTIAPHYCVEDICLKGIESARIAYEQGDLRGRLAKYHRDADSVFYGWCNAWLDPRRRDWSIECLLENIACPSLAIQGAQDEYATLDQIEAIWRHASHTELLEIDGCGHFPFRHATGAVTDAIVDFAARH
jgi:pimeloyl-ACP methyl ester carboxylesterase